MSLHLIFQNFVRKKRSFNSGKIFVKLYVFVNLGHKKLLLNQTVHNLQELLINVALILFVYAIDFFVCLLQNIS